MTAPNDASPIEGETGQGNGKGQGKGYKRHKNKNRVKPGPKPKLRVESLEEAEQLAGSMSGLGGMTLKQRIFCREYLIQNGNATQAAIAAGYSQHTAHVIGAQNLTKIVIRNEIARLQAESARQTDISPARVLRRLDALSRAAEDAGQYAAAKGCEELLGKHLGMFVERSVNLNVSASAAHLEALLEVARRRAEPKDVTPNDT